MMTEDPLQVWFGQGQSLGKHSSGQDFMFKPHGVDDSVKITMLPLEPGKVLMRLVNLCDECTAKVDL